MVDEDVEAASGARPAWRIADGGAEDVGADSGGDGVPLLRCRLVVAVDRVASPATLAFDPPTWCAAGEEVGGTPGPKTAAGCHHQAGSGCEGLKAFEGGAPGLWGAGVLGERTCADVREEDATVAVRGRHGGVEALVPFTKGGLKPTRMSSIMPRW